MLQIIRRLKTLIKYTHIVSNEIVWSIKFKFSRVFQEKKICSYLKWSVDARDIYEINDLKNLFNKNNIVFFEGNHTIYLPPQKNLNLIFKNIIDKYPNDSGFKILKDLNNPINARYLGNHNNSGFREKIRSQIIGTATNQIIVANYLFNLNIGPRLYDLASIKIDNLELSVFVIQDIKHVMPSNTECENFISYLDKLLNTTFLKLVIQNWKLRGDFKCPNCNNNLFIKKNNKSINYYYVDFQNFIVNPINAWTNQILQNHANDLGFGKKRFYRKSEYLYQSISNFTKDAKRNTEKRWDVISKAINNNNNEFKNKIVLDIGCNAGMIIKKSLNSGALWGYGWDLPKVSDIANNLLLSLGETRFKIIPSNLTETYDLFLDIYSNHKKLLNGSIIFYLAVRGHIGMIKNLRNFKFKYFVYEGHQDETIEQSRSYIENFFKKKFEIKFENYIQDGDSSKRPLIIYKNNFEE